MSNSGNCGWNRPASNRPVKKRGGAKAPSMWKGVIAGLAIVVPLAVLLVWMFSGGEDAPKAKPVKERAPVKAVKPAPAPIRRTAKPVSAPDAKPSVPPKPKEPVVISCTTNGTIVRTLIRKPDGKTHLKRRDLREPTFNNGSDQLLAMAAAVVPGEDAPPMPITPSVDKEFMESLKYNIVIKDDDPESVKQMKENVIDFRNQMIELVKDGGSVEDVLRKHQQMLQDSAEFRNSANLALRQLMEEDGDIEVAKEYVRKVNALLAEKGIKPLDEPLTQEERRERALKAYEERKANNKQEGSK